LRNLKCGTTNIEELVDEIVKTWQMKNLQNKQDEFYLEGSYVKYVIDTLLGFPTTPISDIDFHAEIKQQRTMRNETRNFAQHVRECLEKYDINYTEHTNFMYKREIPNITIAIKFLNQNSDLQFKNPENLEFEFTITPTIINPLEITGIPKISYHTGKSGDVKITGSNLIHNYIDIVPNYTHDLDWPRDWSDAKSRFLDKQTYEVTGYKTLADHVSTNVLTPRPHYKTWEQYYNMTTHDDNPRNITVKPGLDMTVEGRVGKVLGTWFTKTDKITDNIIYMLAAFLYTKGFIKDGIDSLIAITRAMFDYLQGKNISKELQRRILIRYAMCIIYALRYNFGTGCKRMEVQHIQTQGLNPDGTYYINNQPRLFVTNDYLLTDNYIIREYKGEISVLSMMLTEMYTNKADLSMHDQFRGMIRRIKDKLRKNCMRLTDEQHIDQELLDYEIH
jgi:hypothetical protein